MNPAADRSGLKAPPATAGFSLLEVVCVLAIVAALAALALPRLSPGTSRQRLHAYAVETAGLLKADRAAAIRSHAAIATRVDAPGRMIRSGYGARSVRLPRDVRVTATLPARCAGAPGGGAIAFLPSGMSCGGAVALTREGVGYEVKVNWLTGGIEIAPRRS